MQFLKILFEKFTGKRPPRSGSDGVEERPPPMPKHLRGIPGVKYSPACDLDRPILKLGNGTDSEALYSREILQNVLITGDTGSGKTSSSARQLALGLLKNKWGGCVFTVKREDVQLWRKYAEQAGRSRDLIEISLEGEHFDPIDYEYRRDGGGDTFNIVELIFDAVEVASRMKTQTNERYWIDNAKRLAYHSIDLLKIAKRRIKLAELKKLLDSAGSEENQVKMHRDFLVECIEEAREREGKGHLTPDEVDALEDAEAYFEKFFVLKESGSIRSTLESSLMYLTTEKIKKLTSGTTIIPEMMFEGAIFLCALPSQIFGDSARAYQALFKRSIQDAVLRRDTRLYPRCTFLYIDEAQELLTGYDRKVLGRSRESRLAHIYITQNIAGMIDELGGDMKAQAIVDSLMGNFVVKIGHRTSCKKTRAVYVDAVDKHYIEDVGRRINIGNGNGQDGGIDARLKLEYQLLPAEFSNLRTGGGDPQNKGQVDAILLNGNRTFKNKRIWLKATFTQEGW